MITQIELEEILEAFNTDSQTEEQECNLILYIIDELSQKNQYDPTEDEICERMRELLAGHVLRSMVNKGVLDVLIDEDGNEEFRTTDLGKEIVKEMRRCAV